MKSISSFFSPSRLRRDGDRKLAQKTKLECDPGRIEVGKKENVAKVPEAHGEGKENIPEEPIPTITTSSKEEVLLKEPVEPEPPSTETALVKEEAPLIEKSIEIAKKEPATETKAKKKKDKKSKKDDWKNDDSDYKPTKAKTKKTKKPIKVDAKQPPITAFFRRSRRVPADLKRKQEDDQIKMYLAKAKDECLEHIVMKNTDLKGRGIFAATKLQKGDFVVEYAGDLMSMEDGKVREADYQKDPSIGSYIYFFSFKGKKYCIDATSESGRYGRLLNHSKTMANCKTRLVEEPEGIPRLIIEAKCVIGKDVELLYDYGDRSKKSLELHPWLAQ